MGARIRPLPVSVRFVAVDSWDQDILGPPFEARTLTLGSDFEGPAVATLVRSLVPASPEGPGAVLYLPGYNDYFFQAHVARFWNDQGFDFYALDPRKGGRSCQPGQTRNLCRRISDYFPEIDQAVDLIRSGLGGRPLLLSGHSTGGLIAASWLSQRPGGVDGLVLDGPFFSSPVPRWLQAFMNPVMGLIARWRPRAAFPGTKASPYARGLHVKYGGLWTFNLDWKRTSGTRMRFGWLAGVHRAQRAVRRGLGIEVPVLALFGERDIVMDVDVNAALTPGIGRDVTVVRLPDAVHDVFLSLPAVRETAFSALKEWLEGTEPGKSPSVTDTRETS